MHLLTITISDARCAIQGTRHLLQQILENPPELITVQFYEGLRGIELSLGKGLDFKLELHQQLERAAILIDDVIKVVRELRDMALSDPNPRAQAAIERQEGPIQYLDKTVLDILQCYKANLTATRDKIRAAARRKKHEALRNLHTSSSSAIIISTS